MREIEYQNGPWCFCKWEGECPFFISCQLLGILGCAWFGSSFPLMQITFPFGGHTGATNSRNGEIWVKARLVMIGCGDSLVSWWSGFSLEKGSRLIPFYVF